MTLCIAHRGNLKLVIGYIWVMEDLRIYTEKHETVEATQRGNHPQAERT